MVRSMQKFLRGTVAVLAVVGSQFSVANLSADELTIGSAAPSLDVEHWVQNGNGKFKPVTEFADGKVYVVEFWATWCGPCIASMPHIVETQQKYADKGVQIVSISDEDLETVEEFLERPYKGGEGDDAPKTYGELTSSYCLTTDPDGSSSKDYMEAANQNGIPCAFIVGKDQKIEWIGHPMSMDDALAQVVEGKWDREAYAIEFKESQKMDAIVSRISRAARTGDIDRALELTDEALKEVKSDAMTSQLSMMKASLLMMSGKVEEAVETLDTQIAQAKSEEMKKQLRSSRIQMLLQDVTNPKLPAAVTKAYKDFEDEPTIINLIAWTIYEAMADGTIEDKDLMKASRAASEKAVEATTDPASKAAVLDTVAHFQFMDGDLKAALKSQEEAVKLADENLKAQLEEFLEEIKSAMEKK